jgi:hypothetical protein
MPTEEPNVADVQAAFRRHGVEPPVAFCAIVARRMIGFAAFTAFEPWQLCGLEEITPLSKRWPSVRLQQDLIPFARHQGSDDLACFNFVAARSRASAKCITTLARRCTSSPGPNSPTSGSGCTALWTM